DALGRNPRCAAHVRGFPLRNAFCALARRQEPLQRRGYGARGSRSRCLGPESRAGRAGWSLATGGYSGCRFFVREATSSTLSAICRAVRLGTPLAPNECRAHEGSVVLLHAGLERPPSAFVSTRWEDRYAQRRFA